MAPPASSTASRPPVPAASVSYLPWNSSSNTCPQRSCYCTRSGRGRTEHPRSLPITPHHDCSDSYLIICLIHFCLFALFTHALGLTWMTRSSSSSSRVFLCLSHHSPHSPPRPTPFTHAHSLPTSTAHSSSVANFIFRKGSFPVFIFLSIRLISSRFIH